MKTSKILVASVICFSLVQAVDSKRKFAHQERAVTRVENEVKVSHNWVDSCFEQCKGVVKNWGSSVGGVVAGYKSFAPIHAFCKDSEKNGMTMIDGYARKLPGAAYVLDTVPAQAFTAAKYGAAIVGAYLTCVAAVNGIEFAKSRLSSDARDARKFASDPVGNCKRFIGMCGRVPKKVVFGALDCSKTLVVKSLHAIKDIGVGTVDMCSKSIAWVVE
ncbi:hypothetical protein HOL34_00530 [bacterium]|nr:hypothetical protein [bacterium]MBT3903553.1 hypothetical protein [bacterium]MBT4578091.1 hypothetical protein [bacterium]MBT5346182.1 hypothetical protein [bacterium]MBT6130978.1 hypothetical protein [bacterium]